MTSFVLHIGLMKTGTTALQESLVSNAGRLLDQGILYPSRRLFQSRHVQLAWSCVADELEWFARWKYDGVTVDAGLAAIQEEVTQAGASTCILSAEDFSLYEPERFLPVIRALQPDLRVIVYLRPQAGMIESMYRQLVKGAGITARFDDFTDEALETCKAGRTPLDYDRWLGLWEQLVPREQLLVRCYGSAARRDIVSDFLGAAGLNAGPFERVPRANESLDGPYLEFVRAANGFLPMEIRHPFLTQVEALQRAHPAPWPASLVSGKRRLEIERVFKQSNARVADRFFGKQDLFNEPVIPVSPARAHRRA